jgi:hypothetical protein
MSITLNGSGLASGITSVPNLATFPAGPRLANVNMPAGTILQTVSGFLNTNASTTNTTPTGTGLSVTITPSSTSSKILVFTDAKIGGTSGNLRFASLVRNGSMIAGGATAGTRLLGSLEYDGGVSTVVLMPMVNCYLDSPATTSATTYSVYFWVYANGTVYINQTGSDRDGNDMRSGSSITVMEIAQ